MLFVLLLRCTHFTEDGPLLTYNHIPSISMGSLSRSFTALAFLLSNSSSLAWQTHRPHHSTRLAVAKESSYVVSRGDGSTGGGGLAMPHETEDESGLRRPKVGAEMPKGRPSWFKVPAPSQGELDCRLLSYDVNIKVFLLLMRCISLSIL